MTKEQLEALKVGDVIRHKHGAEALVVAHDMGRTKIAVRTTHVSNPGEWDRINPRTGRVMR